MTVRERIEQERVAEENEENEEEEGEHNEDHEHDAHNYRLDQHDEEGRYYEEDQPPPKFEILTPADAIRVTELEREQGINVDESVLRARMFSVRQDKSTPIINQNILFEKINYIDLEGKFQADVSPESILEKVNLHKHVLVLVAAERRTARLFLKQDFEQHKLKSKQSQRKSGTAKAVKARQLQVTWNIGDNDLQYRLRKASEYLKKGDRLDIIIGARKSKLTRDKDQRDTMLATIRKTLEPYGYEWMMSQKFPNVELWFQGFDPKKKDKEEAEAAAAAAATVPGEEQQSNPQDTTSTDPEVDISGQDDRYLSEEEAEASTFKVRDRKRQLLEAEEKWKSLFGSKYQDDPYWKQLSDPTYKPPEPALLSPKEKPEEKKPRKDKTHDVEAVKAEFDRKLTAAKLTEQQKELERLKSVATQFAKLGSGKKSMFGGKLAGK